MKSKIIRYAVLFLTALMIASSLCACAGLNPDDGKVSIVCTIFPIYDWTRNIVGDTEGVELTLLGGNGADMHNYQASVSDMVKITTCDVFIYTGGESEEWVKDALDQAVSKDMIVVDLIELLGEKALGEEEVEGMQGEHEDGDADDADEENERDEHIWMSLTNADYFCGCICDAICSADPDNAETYKNNSDSYRNSIKDLLKEGKDKLDAASGSTIIVADRFPYLYLTKEFGIGYYAAFKGCSAETEASFETIAFLSEKLKEIGSAYVIVTESSDRKLALTVISTAGVECDIAVIDSMQSVTKERISAGTSYIDIMKTNFETLAQVLEKN